VLLFARILRIKVFKRMLKTINNSPKFKPVFYLRVKPNIKTCIAALVNTVEHAAMLFL